MFQNQIGRGLQPFAPDTTRCETVRDVSAQAGRKRLDGCPAFRQPACLSVSVNAPHFLVASLPSCTAVAAVAVCCLHLSRPAFVSRSFLSALSVRVAVSDLQHHLSLPSPSPSFFTFPSYPRRCHSTLPSSALWRSHRHRSRPHFVPPVVLTFPFLTLFLIRLLSLVSNFALQSLVASYANWSSVSLSPSTNHRLITFNISIT